MRLTDDGYLVVLGELIGVVFDGLTEKPGRSVVAPGENVAWDDCCNGQLSVRIQGVEPLFQGNNGCPVGYVLTLGISVVRCVATVDDRGRPPSAEQVTMDGHRTTRDMREIANAIQCWRPVDAHVSRLGGWRPLGPSGMCAGGEWTMTLKVGQPL